MRSKRNEYNTKISDFFFFFDFMASSVCFLLPGKNLRVFLPQPSSQPVVLIKDGKRRFTRKAATAPTSIYLGQGYCFGCLDHRPRPWPFQSLWSWDNRCLKHHSADEFAASVGQKVLLHRATLVIVISIATAQTRAVMVDVVKFSAGRNVFVWLFWKERGWWGNRRNVSENRNLFLRTCNVTVNG